MKRYLVLMAGVPARRQTGRCGAGPGESASARADFDPAIAEPFGDRDEGALGTVVEIEERVLSERLDQPHRQRDTRPCR